MAPRRDLQRRPGHRRREISCQGREGILVEGKLSTRKWQDQQGNERYTTEIVLSPFNGILTFLDGRRNGNGNGGERTNGAPPAGPSGDLDDEIPF